MVLDKTYEMSVSNSVYQVVEFPGRSLICRIRVYSPATNFESEQNRPLAGFNSCAVKWNRIIITKLLFFLLSVFCLIEEYLNFWTSYRFYCILYRKRILHTYNVTIRVEKFDCHKLKPHNCSCNCYIGFIPIISQILLYHVLPMLWLWGFKSYVLSIVNCTRLSLFGRLWIFKSNFLYLQSLIWSQNRCKDQLFFLESLV